MSENENNFLEGSSETEVGLEPVNSPVGTGGAACDSGSCGINGCGCGEKKCKLPLIASLILVVALLVGGGVYFYQTVLANPVNTLLLAYANFYGNEEIYSDTEISFEVDKQNAELKNAFNSMAIADLKSSNEQLFNFFAAVLPNFKMKYLSGASSKPEALNLSQGFDIFYKDSSLIDFTYNLKPWELRVDSKKILAKPLYADLAKLVKDGTGGMYDLSKLHLGDYISVFREKDEFITGLKDSEYIKVLKEFLETRVTKEGSKIVVQMTNKESIDLLVKFLAIAKEDEVLKKSFVTKVTKLIQLISDKKDYEAFGISKEEFDTVASKVKVQVDTEFKNVIEQIEKVYTSSQYLTAVGEIDKTVVKSIFTIKGRKIVETESNTNFGGVALSVKTKYADKVTILKDLEGKKVADMDDISNFKDNPLAAITLATTGVSNLEKNVLKGEAFKMMSEDIKNHAKTELEVEDAAKVVYIFDEVMPNLVNKGLNQLFMGGF